MKEVFFLLWIGERDSICVEVAVPNTIIGIQCPSMYMPHDILIKTILENAGSIIDIPAQPLPWFMPSVTQDCSSAANRH